MEEMAALITDWDGSMVYDSVAASVYTYIRYWHTKSLFAGLTDLNNNDRMHFTRGMFSIHYVELSIRLLTNATEGGTHFNPICNQPDKRGQYK